ncbi:MFS transporter [Mycolicibacterium fortuitum]|uniref:MFS transporter n=1 Tax=Mycolicibacterium fortuitum TaxID=1766 RepID=UPI0007F03509|nr:MFS transporter [Mycolicibacterium fortuitum]OBK61833.1 MFS transporter [Mycolicibacterium fortuitum]
MDNRTRTVVAALSVGTLLSPLNSSMIAVAPVPLRHDFGLDAAEVTWVVTVFYLASATGQPLMGRLGDRFGPRRVFTIGMAATVIVCAATVWVTSFGMLCVGRAGLALTSAVAFPCAITIIRPLSRSSGVPPSHLLGRIQIASTAGAAVGPVLGGVLETMYGWQAIMAINIPLATLAAVGAALAPPDTARTAGSLLSTIRASDLPGIALFVVSLVSLLSFLLGLASAPPWWLLALALAAGVAFTWRESRTSAPFLDVRAIASNRTLTTVYASFTMFNLVFYIAFFGLPQTLQDRGHYSSGITGVLMIPLAAVTVVLTPVIARVIDRRGLPQVLRAGTLMLAVGTALLLLAGASLHPVVVIVMTAALGVPYCVGNLAHTQALYAAADPGQSGVASGTFQATRYLGAILAISVLGVTLADGDTPISWSVAALIALVFAVLHLVVVWRWRIPGTAL